MAVEVAATVAVAADMAAAVMDAADMAAAVMAALMAAELGWALAGGLAAAEAIGAGLTACGPGAPITRAISPRAWDSAWVLPCLRSLCLNAPSRRGLFVVY